MSRPDDQVPGAPADQHAAPALSRPLRLLLERVGGRSVSLVWTGGITRARLVLTELRGSADLLRMVRGHLWFLPSMAMLALLAALFEGLGLTLIIPLVQALSDKSAAPPTAGPLGILFAAAYAFPPETRIVAMLALIFGAVIARCAFSYANMALLAVIYGRLSHRLRTAVFDRILATPLARFEQERSGRLLNILENETWRATDAVTLMFTVITSISTILVFFGLLVLLSWQLALAAILFVTLIPPFMHLIARHAKKLSGDGLRAHEALAYHTWSVLSGLRTIHIFGSEEAENRRFGEASERVRNLFFRMSMISMTTGPVAEILGTLLIAALVLLASNGQIGIGATLGFIAILFRLQPQLIALVSAQSDLARLHASVGAVKEIVFAPETPVDVGTQPFDALKSAIRFDNVTFTYPGAERPALAGLSFDILQGAVVAVVGASGAGKSTLLDLLLHFQVPQAGAILVDGVPLDDLSMKDWRGRIGVVNQDPYMFDDTIRANLLFARPDATEAQLVDAARIAAAHDFIRAFPSGYDTLVGERGAQISGGQRQRIALARALLRDPDILMLDEATNALDTLTERAFREALARFARERTVFIVAHRLATVIDADHVLVLKDGVLVEQGKPAALLAGEGLFAQMFAGHKEQAAFAPGAQSDPVAGS